jgi:PAS domain S-box-containing protein
MGIPLDIRQPVFAGDARIERPFRTSAVLAALIVLTAVGVLSYRASIEFEDRVESVKHTNDVQLAIAALQEKYTQTRLHWRSYLISQSPGALREFEFSSAGLQSQMHELLSMIRDNPGQQQRLARARSLMETDIGTMTEVAALRKKGLLSSAEDILARLEAVSPSVIAFGAVAREMFSVEKSLLEAREKQSELSARRLRIAMVSGSAAALAILVAAYLALLRENRTRLEAQRQAQKSARESEDLYDNAPCGYHSVDKDGLIVKMNATLLAWLGYRKEEVVGQLRHPDLMTAESAAYFADHAFPLFKRQGWLKDIEFDYRRSDGSVLSAALNATTVYDENGNYVSSRSTTYDITARKHAEAEVRSLNATLAERAADLEAANKELESFSYSVSHDLRSPLRAIDGYSLMLQEDYGGRLDDEGRRLLGVVRENSARMATLIDDLLAFSRLGRKPVAKAPVEMEALAREVLNDIPRDKAVEISVGTLPGAQGDRALLRQVWMNLSSNAVKYSSKHPAARIEIGGRTDDAECIYWVRDNGVGFDMRYYRKLFGVFQRLHGHDEFPGTGVGLAIVQRVVARHGGRVWAESAPGKGASFYFSLPNREHSDVRP